MNIRFRAVLDEISKNEQDIKKFVSCDSIQEMYEFFKSKSTELSYEEFESNMIELLELGEDYFNKSSSLTGMEQINFQDLNMITGGVGVNWNFTKTNWKNMRNKFLHLIK